MLPARSIQRPREGHVSMATEFFARGNAVTEATRGWFIGQFLPEAAGLRRREDVEVKLGIHPKGECRRGWSSNRRATTISVLVAGRFLLKLRRGEEVREVRLERLGDYVVIPPGVWHYWEAPEDCTLVTVRSPSLAGDQVDEDG